MYPCCKGYLMYIYVKKKCFLKVEAVSHVPHIVREALYTSEVGDNFSLKWATLRSRKVMSTIVKRRKEKNSNKI